MLVLVCVGCWVVGVSDCMPAVDGDVGISLCWVLGGRSF